MARSASHPGEHLAEAIEAVGSTAAKVARDVGAPIDRIADTLCGKHAITTDMALRLGRYLGISEAFWMNLQRICGRAGREGSWLNDWQQTR
jgi:addiction module HigA family antidote